MPRIDFSTVTFSVEEGCLVASVVPRRGTPYRHHCPKAAFESVAHAVENAGPKGLTRAALREQLKLPETPVSTALMFLYERSIIERAGKHRSTCVAQPGCHMDAMCEYHALAEGAAGKEGQP